MGMSFAYKNADGSSLSDTESIAVIHRCEAPQLLPKVLLFKQMCDMFQ